jgi:hypothetical protein
VPDGSYVAQATLDENGQPVPSDAIRFTISG